PGLAGGRGGERDHGQERGQSLDRRHLPAARGLARRHRDHAQGIACRLVTRREGEDGPDALDAYLLVALAKAAASWRVTEPGRPEPIFSPLTARSGTTPEMLLVRKASLARARSFSLSGWRGTRPRRMTQARVTPGRSGSCTGGVMSFRSTTANRLAAEASAIPPCPSESSASSAPLARARRAAST